MVFLLLNFEVMCEILDSNHLLHLCFAIIFFPLVVNFLCYYSESTELKEDILLISFCREITSVVYPKPSL